MRRIIERVVTVVTTTTWKISWEHDPPHSDHQIDPVFNDLTSSELFSEPTQSAQPHSSEKASKEADLQGLKPETNPRANKPPKDS